MSYPEGAAGHVDLPPGDDDGVFDGFGGNVDADEGAVSSLCDLDVDGESLCVLEAQTHTSITLKSQGCHCQSYSGEMTKTL